MTEDGESPLDRLEVMRKHLDLLEQDLEQLREDLARSERPKK